MIIIIHGYSKSTIIPSLTLFTFPSCLLNYHLDFYDLSVLELSHEFVLSNDAILSSLPHNVVVFEIEPCFVLLTIHDSGKLGVFRCGDDQWTIVPEMRNLVDDSVCVFKGKPIAVDSTGKTVRVRVGIEPKLGLDLVADPVFGGVQKYLVESNGELLLVDKLLSCVLDDDGVGGGDDAYGVGRKRAVKFDVYRLDEKEKRWVELTSLGDRTLFLRDDCAFSLSDSDLGSWYRNCVIFRDDAFNKYDSKMGVFDLDLWKKKDYDDLFWPPEWIKSR